LKTVACRDLFDPFTLDQLHTLATALGNAVKNISEHRSTYPQTSAYMGICIQDNEDLLAAINETIKKKVNNAQLRQ
jgi:hypothetical protein